ncbi:hypothetical protein Pyn_18753 [Prunus yedoensis var. nudiflora]|uniref:Uncharacterized protein n=1 Tax=Prunus yedoensis var. nudiflora TaxID=2094558 RepID=A0A314UBW4_PRUYE|nr:hypothetical protein Pyn_18753 [Prunus yedoensis var. nudiflora]
MCSTGSSLAAAISTKASFVAMQGCLALVATVFPLLNKLRPNTAAFSPIVYPPPQAPPVSLALAKRNTAELPRE